MNTDVQPFLLALVVAAAISLTAPSSSSASVKQIGTWRVEIEDDPFGDGQRKIALAIDRGNAVDFDKSLSIAVAKVQFGTGRFTEGMPSEVKFRAGKNEVIERDAVAVDDKIIEISDDDGAIAAQIRDNNEFAL